MKTKKEIIKTLKGLKETLKKKYKIKELGIFGSVIREDQVEASDIDILVDFEEDADLFDLTGLALSLEKEFNQRVDVVSKRALRKEIRESVLREVVPV